MNLQIGDNFMWCSDNWKDYELLDASDGERLERWGKYVLVRPDPQIIWRDVARHSMWNKADGVYRRSQNGGGGFGRVGLSFPLRVYCPRIRAI